MATLLEKVIPVERGLMTENPGLPFSGTGKAENLKPIPVCQFGLGAAVAHAAAISNTPKTRLRKEFDPTIVENCRPEKKANP